MLRTREARLSPAALPVTQPRMSALLDQLTAALPVPQGASCCSSWTRPRGVEAAAGAHIRPGDPPSANGCCADLCKLQKGRKWQLMAVLSPGTRRCWRSHLHKIRYHSMLLHLYVLISPVLQLASRCRSGLDHGCLCCIRTHNISTSVIMLPLVEQVGPPDSMVFRPRGQSDMQLF
jgi:hypothetical protein